MKPGIPVKDTTLKKVKTETAVNIYKRAQDITDQEIMDALEATGGIRSAAARLLQSKTGVKIDRTTLSKRLKRNPQFHEAMLRAEENVADMAEGALINAIRDGNMTAVIFYLKTKGRERGYVERRELEAKVKVTNPYKDLSTDELRKLAQDEEE